MVKIFKSLSIFLGFSLLVAGLIPAGVTAVSDYVEKNKYMSLSDASKKWGHEKFEIEKFKSGDVQVKSSMAVSLIESHFAIGKNPDELRKELGDFTGHFWNDFVPTYLIEHGSYSEKKDAWQLVFLLGYKKKIREVRIHKSCCENYQEIEKAK